MTKNLGFFFLKRASKGEHGFSEPKNVGPDSCCPYESAREKKQAVLTDFSTTRADEVCRVFSLGFEAT